MNNSKIIPCYKRCLVKFSIIFFPPPFFCNANILKGSFPETPSSLSWLSWDLLFISYSLKARMCSWKALHYIGEDVDRAPGGRHLCYPLPYPVPWFDPATSTRALPITACHVLSKSLALLILERTLTELSGCFFAHLFPFCSPSPWRGGWRSSWWWNSDWCTAYDGLKSLVKN